MNQWAYVMSAYILIGTMISIYAIGLRSRFRRAQKAMPGREDEADE